MVDKLKIIVLALVILLAVSLFIIFSIQNSRLALVRDYSDTRQRLTQENEQLTNKLNNVLAKKGDLEDRLEFIQEELEQISREKDELERKYELVNKERIGLLEASQTQVQAGASVTPIGLSVPEGEDSRWAGILKGKAGLKLQLGNLNKKLNDLQIDNQKLQNEKASLESKINSLNQQRQELERKLRYKEKLFNNVSAELFVEKNDKSQLQKSLTNIKEENKTLRKELDRLDRQRLVLEERLMSLFDEKEYLVARVGEAELMLDKNESETGNIRQEFEGLLKSKAKAETSGIKANKDSVELPTIVVSSPSAVGVDELARVEGKIITVNKEQNFVVINLGQSDGISEDMEFEVFREDSFLGKVKVIQLREEIAACDIIQTEAPFKINDIVKY